MGMNYVNGKCKSQVDGFSSKDFPHKFYHPKIGEKVRSINSHQVLTIVEITHSEENDLPFLIIELNRG